MPTDKDELTVVFEAFDVEKKKWLKLAGDISVLKGKMAGLNLMPTAFFCGEPATALQLSRSYDEIYALIGKLMTDAAQEFDQIGGALQIAADRYDGSDQQSAQTLEAIYGSGRDEDISGGP
ncbi:hypothetical protein GCM10027280_31350 [Micromonospora polyrhachis]|uniref:Uncharacterized protein YukE n=1 Tax=Micromonospora polyrhachis TaxID=1282883 RepID=A0A7W7SUE2_9ACTN|nr:hypothetical protein [Micromonospora polyrhachis]MBB4961162.1 uncharacterized protein YukE [Micromonospora polyrhachis]